MGRGYPSANQLPWSASTHNSPPPTPSADAYTAPPAPRRHARSPPSGSPQDRFVIDKPAAKLHAFGRSGPTISVVGRAIGRNPCRAACGSGRKTAQSTAPGWLRRPPSSRSPPQTSPAPHRSCAARGRTPATRPEASQTRHCGCGTRTATPPPERHPLKPVDPQRRHRRLLHLCVREAHPAGIVQRAQERTDCVLAPRARSPFLGRMYHASARLGYLWPSRSRARGRHRNSSRYTATPTPTTPSTTASATPYRDTRPATHVPVRSSFTVCRWCITAPAFTSTPSRTKPTPA